MKLRFTRRAIEDLMAIGDYVAGQNPVAAVRVRSAILQTLQLLVEYPRIGRPQTVEGVRKIVTRRYSYIIYYSVDADAEEVVIITVQHPARAREFTDQ
jgi:plasmid stabilization system protein ParE